MSSLIRKASHTVFPLTVRAIASPRILSSLVIKAAEHGRDVHKRSFVISNHSNFCTVSDHALKRVDQKIIKALKSEIKSAKPSDPSDIQMPEAPTDFPFKIEDIPGEDTIKLTREFAGEKIIVSVYDPIYPQNWSDQDTTDVSDDDGGRADNLSTDSSDDEKPEKRSISFNEPLIPLTLNISKEDGTTSLRICFWANVGYIGHPQIFVEDGLRISNEMSFDKEDYWREFIRVRGIDDSSGKFMMDYMEWRSNRDYLLCLKKLRNFVEE